MRFALGRHRATARLDAATADELAHEAVVAHFFADRRGQRIANSRAFILGALRFQVVTYRRQRRRSVAAVEERPDLAASVPPVDEADIARLLQAMPANVARSLRGLVESASDDDLAQRQGVTPDAVRKRRQRAHAWVRANFLACGGHE